MKLSTRLASILCLSLLIVTYSALGQAADADLDLGMKPYGAYHGGAIDTVNMANGNLSVHIPLFSFPQRGNLKLGYSIVFNSKHYTNKTICDSLGDCTQYSVLLSPLAIGPAVGPDYSLVVGSSIVQPVKGSPPIFDLYYIADAFGAKHPLAQVAGSSSGTYESVDATGFSYNPSTSLLIDPAGTRNATEDVNGNELTYNSSGQVVDSLGRTPAVLTTVAPASSGTTYPDCSAGPLTATNEKELTALGPNGAASVYKECFVTIPVITSFNVNEGTTVTGNLSALQSVLLPDGTSWIFSYSSGGLGNLASITFPTGGTVSYTWVQGSSQCSNTYMATSSVSTRTVNANDGAGNHVWTYAVSGVATGSVPVHVTDPLQNDTVYSFLTIGPGGACVQYPSVVQSYQGSYSQGSLLRTETTQYSYVDTLKARQGNSGLNYIAPALNVVPLSVTTAWANGQTSSVVKTYDAGFSINDPSSLVSATYPGTYGKVLTESDYDYGSGQAGALLRKIVTDYLAFDNANYLANNLLIQPSSISIYDGSSSLVAQTTYGYDETALQSSGVTTGRDTSPPAGTYRGNQTSEKKLLNGKATATLHCNVSVSNGMLVNTTTYFDTGMEYQTTDDCSHATTYTYSGTYVGAYVTQSSNPLGQTASASYDFNTGLKTSSTDVYKQPTSYTYDNMWRTTNVFYPDTYQGTSGETAFQYNVLTSPANVVITKTASPSPPIQEEIDVDGVGREAVTKLLTDPAGTTYTRTSYDGLGRKSQIWNPTRCNPVTSTSCSTETTWGITTYTYDALGRTLVKGEPDSNIQTWSYSGNTVTITDESKNQWQQSKDPLGRLTQVLEPNGVSTTPTMETDYSYDPLSNLLSVKQWGGPSGTAGSRTRSFGYDSLSRLLQAYNPEAGWLCYGTTGGVAPTGANCTSSYDANGNLLAKTDARGITVNYAYDALDRLTDKTYPSGNSTPVAHFNYDETSVTVGTSTNSHSGPYTIQNGIGRLTSQYAGMSAPGVGVAVKSFSYDPMGRVLQSAECWGVSECASAYGTRPSAWTYDLAGKRLSLDNSASRIFSYTYDGSGRLLTASNNGVGITTPMVSNVVYSPHGQPRTMTTSSSGATVTGTWGADSRLRVTSYTNLSTATTGNTNYGYSLTYTPNSNVKTIAETAYSPGSGGKSWSWTNSYDTLNRLAQATSAGAILYSCGETYDAWGNRTNQAPVGTAGYSCTSISTPVATNNRLGAYTYDAAGELLFDGSNSLTYDAEGRISTSSPTGGSTTSYTYGADGQRIGKTAGGVTANYVRDLDGSLLATYVGGGYTNQPQEMWIAGKHFGTVIATSGSTQTQNFSLTNWLGSEAARTNPVNGIALSAYLSEPFGDAQLTLFGSDRDDVHLTGKERDAESGNDYFGARYYASSIGRFLSPDWAEKPEDVPYADLTNPQSLNLYSYAHNNPLSDSDVDGHVAENEFGPSPGSQPTRGDPQDGRQEIRPMKSDVAWHRASKAAQEALHKIDAFMSAGSDFLNDHPVLAMALTFGLNPQADEMAEPALEDEVEAISSRVEATFEEGAQSVKTAGHGDVGGGSTTAQNALTQANNYLGPGAKEIRSGVFRSADGTRQFRMTTKDITGAHGKIGPHVHFESIGPDGRTITENSHVGIE